MHDLLELVLGALVDTQLLVHDLEVDIILLRHVVRTSATILDSRGEANIRRRLREDRGVERVILDITDDGLRRGNMSLIDFSLRSGSYGCLQVEFLEKNALTDAVLGP